MSDLTPIVARHPFCEGLAPEHVALLAGCAKNVKFADGQRLFRNGDEADETFLIRAGRVRYTIHGSTALETAEEGELVGWSWLFPPYRWHFDAAAIGQVRAFQLDGACLRRKCEADPAFGFEITKRILYQVHRRLERSRLQAMDVFGGQR